MRKMLKNKSVGDGVLLRTNTETGTYDHGKYAMLVNQVL